MEPAHILVGVMTGAAVVFLVWAELRSRRNTALVDKTQSAANPGSPTVER